MDKIKICWLGKKHKGNFVCFIPLTIDGTGKTANDALKNLEEEASKIIGAIKTAGIKCNFSLGELKSTIEKHLWWRKQDWKERKKEGEAKVDKDSIQYRNKHGQFPRNKMNDKYTQRRKRHGKK